MVLPILSCFLLLHLVAPSPLCLISLMFWRGDREVKCDWRENDRSRKPCAAMQKCPLLPTKTVDWETASVYFVCIT